MKQHPSSPEYPSNRYQNDLGEYGYGRGPVDAPSGVDERPVGATPVAPGGREEVFSSELPPPDDTPSLNKTRPFQREQEPSRDSLRDKNPVNQTAVPSPRPVNPPDGNVFRQQEGGFGAVLASEEMRRLIAGLSIPPTSPSLQELLITVFGMSSVDGEHADATALQLAVLFKAGQLSEIERLVENSSDRQRSAVLGSFYGLSLLAMHGREKACDAGKSLSADGLRLQPQLIGQIHLFNAYCALGDKRFDEGRRALNLARAQGVQVDVGTAVLSALESGQPLELNDVSRLSLLDYGFFRLGEWDGISAHVERAEPAALLAMVSDKGLKRRIYMQAVERAVRLNIVGADVLGEAYQGLRYLPAEFENPLAARLGGVLRRGLLYQSVLKAKSVEDKIPLLSALLKEAREARLFGVTASLLSEEISEVPIEAQYADFAETAVEALMAAHEFDLAARWARGSQSFSVTEGRQLSHWLILAELSDGELSVPLQMSIEVATAYAAEGGFSPDVLHRLVTVLDALGYQVPLPLWDRANRHAQPNQGFLPARGILSRLKKAGEAPAKDVEGRARAALLAMAALGSGGPHEAHILALGDSIRALKASGLEFQARLIGFEALFQVWPRRAGH